MPLPAYNFYTTVHKYVRVRLFEVCQQMAKTDFQDSRQFSQLQADYHDLIKMLEGHGAHEDREHVRMLRDKASPLVSAMHEQHCQLEDMTRELSGLFEDANKSKDQAYALYLKFVHFVATYLEHTVYEETAVMPELSRLYSREQLRTLADRVHSVMTDEQMDAMLDRLFPPGNRHDREAFLQDICEGAPTKFPRVFSRTLQALPEDEAVQLRAKFPISN
jgi:hypothetical protein